MDQDFKVEKKVKRIFEKAYQSHINGRLNEAEKLYIKILKLDPNQADALNNLGCIAYLKEQFNLSLKWLLRLNKLHPDFVDGLNNLGKTYDRLNDTPNAIRCLQRALDLDPDNEDTLVLIGSLLLRTYKPEQAIECLKYCLQIHPESALAYHNLSVSYEGQKKFSEAIEAAKQACANDPDNKMFEEHHEHLFRELNKNEESPEETQ